VLNLLYLRKDDEESMDTYLMIKTIMGTKAKIHETISQEEAFNIVAVEGPINLFVFDVDDLSYDPIFLTEQYLNFSEEAYVLYIGTETNIKNRVDNKLYSKVPVQALTRPYNKQQMIHILSDFLSDFQKKEDEKAMLTAKPAEFIALKLKSFYLFKKVPADCYVKLSNNQYMKVLKKEVPFTHAQIQVLARRKVKELYLYRDEAITFLEASVVDCIHLVNKVRSLKENLQFYVNSISLIQTYLRTLGISVSITELTTRLIDHIHRTFDKEIHLRKLLNIFPFQEGSASEKAVLTIILCDIMSEKINFRSNAARDKLSLSAILCDATLSNDEMTKLTSLNDPSLKLFSPEEINEFKEHPIKASQLASLIPKYSEVEFIIQQHHEIADGSGFPSKVTSQTITTVSAIFIIANNLSSYICQRELSTDVLKQGLLLLKDTHHKQKFKQPFIALYEEFVGKY
jgi:hypothetical protein